LITSRQTDPDLYVFEWRASEGGRGKVAGISDRGTESWGVKISYISSTLGWKRRFMNPIEGDLKGYSGGSVTCTFQEPPS